ncbi:MAG: PadR family transcriptional regulator [Gemmatimonadetes bacterium]|nr:PadR family transcriptional regulator [Gemmatimonadota bacterium]
MQEHKPLSLGTVMVLHALARGRQYGFDIIEETGLTSGTIYPALERLERLGLARSKWEDGKVAQQEKWPARRYYQITGRGSETLMTAMERYRSLAPVDTGGVQHPRAT